MAWIAVDKNGEEWIYEKKPTREDDIFGADNGNAQELDNGFIESILGRKLTWEDEPVELKEVQPLT